MRTGLALARAAVAIGLVAAFLISTSEFDAWAEEDPGAAVDLDSLLCEGGTSEEFEHHYPAEELIARQAKSGRWGYVRWDDVREGRVELVVTKEDPVWQILPRFESAGCFQEGAAPVEMNGSWGMIDESGGFVIPPSLSSPCTFVGGTAVVEIDRQWAVVGRSGQVLAKPKQVEFVADFTEGVAAAEKDGKWGYIDLAGEFVIAPQFDDANEFTEGLAAVAVGAADGGESKWRYILKNGSWLSEQEFDYAGHFHCGRAIVCVGNKWGVLDCFGKLVVPPKFEAMSSQYCEGLVRAKSNGKWGYLDLRGNFVIEPTFDNAGDFEDGFACVLYGDQLCVIDPLGNFKQRISRQDKSTSAVEIAGRAPRTNSE